MAITNGVGSCIWVGVKRYSFTVWLYKEPKKFKGGEWVKDESWPGYYCTNDYQEITIDDTKNFAGALEKALEYMSAKSLSETNAVAECDDYGWDEDCLDDIHSLVNAWSSLDGQKKIKGFIKLFQSGACNIG